jgi:hypothetical protein
MTSEGSGRSRARLKYALSVAVTSEIGRSAAVVPGGTRGWHGPESLLTRPAPVHDWINQRRRLEGWPEV